MTECVNEEIENRGEKMRGTWVNSRKKIKEIKPKEKCGDAKKKRKAVEEQKGSWTPRPKLQAHIYQF